MQPRNISNPDQLNFDFQRAPTNSGLQLAQLAEQHAFGQVLNLDTFEARANQVDVIESVLQHAENALIMAETNSGKSFVFLAIASPKLQAQKRVLLVTPTVDLVTQGVHDAKRVTQIGENVCGISGGDPSKRRLTWADQTKRLIYATPDVIVNDGMSILQHFDLVAFDEVQLLLQGDKTELKNSYYKIMQYVEALSTKPQIICLSATPAKNSNELLALMYVARTSRFHYMPSTRGEIPMSITRIDLNTDPQISTNKHLLECAANFQVGEMLSRLVGMQGHYKSSSDTHASLKQAISTISTICKLKSSGFTMPFQGALLDFRQLLADIANHANIIDVDRKTLGQVISRWCSLQHIRHAHMLLTTTSKACTLDFLAKEILLANFSNDKLSPYQRGLYTRNSNWSSASNLDSSNPNQLIGRVFSSLSSDTLYAELLSQRTLTQLCNNHLPNSTGLPSAQIHARLLEKFMQQIVNRWTFDHPKEEFLSYDLRGHFSRKNAGLCVVFTNLASHARFLSQRIATWGIAANALPLAGKLHMSTKERNTNLQALRSGQAKIGVWTSVGKRGLHLHGTELVIHYVPPKNAEELVQGNGRVTPNSGKGYAMAYLSRDTQDEAHIRVARRQKRKMERELKGQGDLLPFPDMF